YVRPAETRAAIAPAGGGKIVPFDRDVLSTRGRVAERLAIDLSSEAGRVLERELARCYKANDRQGFRQKHADDLADPAYGEALAAGAEAMIALHGHAAGFADWCRRQDLARIYEDDFAIFAPRLAAIYGKGREAAVSETASGGAGGQDGTGG